MPKKSWRCGSFSRRAALDAIIQRLIKRIKLRELTHPLVQDRLIPTALIVANVSLHGLRTTIR